MSLAVLELKKSLKIKEGLEYSTDIHSVILAGIRKSILEEVTQLLGITKKDMLKVLPISDTQLRRVGEKQKLTAQVSEHIIAIAEVVIAGYELINDPKDFKDWLFENNLALENQKPYDFLSTVQGCGILKTILYKVAHGIPS